VWKVEQAMSTITEIEEAIENLPAVEREILERRIYARHSLEVLSDAERAALLASLNEAEAEIERGESFTSEEMHASVRSWTGR